MIGHVLFIKIIDGIGYKIRQCERDSTANPINRVIPQTTDRIATTKIDGLENGANETPERDCNDDI